MVFESPLVKVFPDAPPPDGKAAWRVEMARGERESFQMLVTAGDGELRDVTVESSLDRNSGLEAEVSLAGFVRTGPADKRPWAKMEGAGRIGWWPDPLLPNRRFDLAAGETQPVWVTVSARPGTRAGEYKGTLRVRLAPGQRRDMPFRVRVYAVDLPLRQELRNAAFMSPPALYRHYQTPGGIDGEEFSKLYQRWVRKAFSLHLGPTFDMLMGWVQGGGPPKPEAESGRAAHLSWPVRWNNGYDFSRTEPLVAIGREYGMRQFAIGIFDRRETWEQHTATYKTEFADYLRSYAAFLRGRGMLQEAYVYNADEPPARLWDTVRANYRFVKEAVPDLKVWLCLNEPAGVKALAGSTDIWDVYIRQYEKSGVRARQESGEQVIWAVCVWPHEHPNLFIEYPAADARAIGWLTYRYGTAGFEYWSLNSWGPNLGVRDWANFQAGNTRTKWQPTRWPWGDGWLLYPGPSGEPLSSVRFENLRDGFEDAELLLRLTARGRQAEAARIADALSPSIDHYTPDPDRVAEARRSLLEALAR
jgi:hypothetical protein